MDPPKHKNVNILKIKRSLNKDCIEPIKCQCCPHIETNQLICTANQMIGFYMRATLTLNGLLYVNGYNIPKNSFLAEVNLELFLRTLLPNILTVYRSNHWRCSVKRRSYKFSKIHRKHLCQSLFFNKVAFCLLSHQDKYLKFQLHIIGNLQGDQ